MITYSRRSLPSNPVAYLNHYILIIAASCTNKVTLPVKTFSLLCINYLQVHLVFLVFYVCIVRVKRKKKCSLLFAHFKQILCVTNRVCSTAGATFPINGFFKFVMGKGGFLKIEAPGFNLDTSSVSPGYVPVHDPVFCHSQIFSAYLT